MKTTASRPRVVRGTARATNPAPALAELERLRAEFIGDIAGLCRVAGVSSARPATEDMRISAAMVASLADRAGLEGARTWEMPEAPPWVTAEWRHAPGAPTVLLYSHYDVQPPGERALWTSGPTEPAIRGGRLYARGAADDKGGIVAQLAAIACHLRAGRPLPCNVRLLVDGEEEVGSPHLAEFLSAHPELSEAGAIVVLDTPNVAVGRPALTCSLRGNATFDLEVRCLEAPVHSGRGGGLVPDPIQILCELIHRLGGNAGRLPGPARPARVAAPAGATAVTARFDATAFRRELGLLDGVRFAGNPRVAPLERLWSRGSLTVIGFEVPAIAGASNQIAAAARARVSMRTAPGADPLAAFERIRRRLEAAPPFGADVRVSIVRTIPGWSADPGGPAHRLALDALAKGYGQPAAVIGAGGSIGFMGAIALLLPDAPCLLLGFEDPECRAHAPDESLHLGDWERATRSLIHLLHDLSEERSLLR